MENFYSNVVKNVDIFFPKLITHTNNNQLYLNNILRISFKMDIIVASDNK